MNFHLPNDNHELFPEEEKRAQSPSYKKWLVEQEQLELFRRDEEERVQLESHQRWLHEEELAKKRWLEQQERLKRIKAEKIKREVTFKMIHDIWVGE